MADAAGAFVTRAFERILREAQGKKYVSLQKALREYLDRPQSEQQQQQQEQHQHEQPDDAPMPIPAEEGAESVPGSPAALASPHRRSSSQLAAATMAEAGHTLAVSEAELILQPLRLAMETKQPKLVETALDCLHKLISYGHLEGEAGVEGGKNAPMLVDIFNKVCACVDNTATDSTVLQVIKVLLTAVASSKFQVHGECLLNAIRTCYSIVLTSKSHVNQATAKATLTQMISIVFKRMESDFEGIARENGCSRSSSMPAGIVPTGEGHDPSSLKPSQSSVKVEELQHLAVEADIKGLEAVLEKAVQLECGTSKEELDLETLVTSQKEALLVMRTLCKMAMKEGADDMIVRTKVLSLELLQGLLENVGQAFTTNFAFIDSVKTYLCYALLRASVNTNAVVFQHACGVFMVLLFRFRESLKAEIGVFFPVVVLRLLDSAEIPAQQRLALLKVLEKVCKDPQMLADLFVNYDCDLDAMNLFERMVSSLSKVAQGTVGDPSALGLAQSTALKGSALQCLVNAIKSLAAWNKTRDDYKKELSLSVADSNAATNQAADFGKAKAHKSSLETAVAEFNRDPAKGVGFLVANNIIAEEPTAVAQFLRTTGGLDKNAVGDYLGQHEEFPVLVMHAYIEGMSFGNMKFDQAIRELLKGFRLPGEAQKIDRIMEKFAERFCHDNPDVFKGADAAYVLAYAAIMLNTDAHNPMVWPKMTKEDFVRLNSRADTDEHPPTELLESVYESIKREEIKLKDDMGPGPRKSDVEEKGRLLSILNLGISKRRSPSDAKEQSDEIIRRTQALFKQVGEKKGMFIRATDRDLARPMLEVIGWPLLAAFSVTMEDSENKSRVTCCMEGFRSGIHLTKELGVDTLRYAFLTSLIRFTFLHAPKEMRGKNVEALKALLSLAENDPEALSDTWNAVLECVSRLEHITSSPTIIATLMYGSNQISRDALAQSLIELTGKPVEQVFVNSVRLQSDVIVEFFTALCGVSAEELKQVPARVFSLQKLVEISYYNMTRIRMVWARIWSVLSQHFVAAGSHYDEKVAMYAIDSLRQLGLKYIERTELAHFSFQNDILKPFVVLMRTSKSIVIRKMIVDCVVQMIKLKVGNIRSGWKSVFMVFTTAAYDDTEAIADLAFENLEQVILENFDQVSGDCFMDGVNCLIAFANNKISSRISLKAIALLRICEDRLAEGRLPGVGSKAVETVSKGTDTEVAEYFWFPMLAGLSDLTSDPRMEVRNCALEVLFDLLKERGHQFSKSFWESVFQRVLFPIFDYVRHAGRNGEKLASAEQWLRETCIHSLQLLCDLFSAFYKDVSFLLPSLLELLADCITRTDQSLASISVSALVRLTELAGQQFREQDWSALLETVRDACYMTQPVELLNPESAVSEVTQKASNVTPVVTPEWDNESQESSRLSVDSVSANGDSGKLPGRASLETRTESDGHETPAHVEAEGFSPTPPASEEGKAQASGGLFGNTLGRRFVDVFLKKNLSLKKSTTSDEPSPQPQVNDDAEEDVERAVVDGDTSVLLPTVRTKCLTQMLLLGAIENIQGKHWNLLQPSHKIQIMDTLLSVVDFASSYNSSSNLRARIQQLCGDVPAPNLLRQEVEGTCVYLAVLNQAAGCKAGFEADGELREEAERRLVTFYCHVLRLAVNLVPIPGEGDLRSLIMVKVLKSMSEMDGAMFRRHLPEFYPYFTKLICSDQMEVRRALGDVFKLRLGSLLP